MCGCFIHFFMGIKMSDFMDKKHDQWFVYTFFFWKYVIIKSKSHFWCTMWCVSVFLTTCANLKQVPGLGGTLFQKEIIVKPKNSEHFVLKCLLLYLGRKTLPVFPLFVRDNNDMNWICFETIKASNEHNSH